MNAKSKECFTELIKICLLYSELTDNDMDISLKHVMFTDTGKSIVNNNQLTMNNKDKNIIKNILAELKSNNIINKDYSDDDIDKVMLNYNPCKLDIFNTDEKWGCNHCLLN